MHCCDKTAFIQLTSVWQRWNCRNKTKQKEIIHWCLWLIFIPFKEKKISVGSLLLDCLDRRTKSMSLSGSKQTHVVALKGKKKNLPWKHQLWLLEMTEWQSDTNTHTQGKRRALICIVKICYYSFLYFSGFVKQSFTTGFLTKRGNKWIQAEDFPFWVHLTPLIRTFRILLNRTTHTKTQRPFKSLLRSLGQDSSWWINTDRHFIHHGWFQRSQSVGDEKVNQSAQP